MAYICSAEACGQIFKSPTCDSILVPPQLLYLNPYRWVNYQFVIQWHSRVNHLALLVTWYFIAAQTHFCIWAVVISRNYISKSICVVDCSWQQLGSWPKVKSSQPLLVYYSNGKCEAHSHNGSRQRLNHVISEPSVLMKRVWIGFNNQTGF